MRLALVAIFLLGAMSRAETPAKSEEPDQVRRLKVLIGGDYYDVFPSPVRVDLKDLAPPVVQPGDDAKAASDRFEKMLREKYGGKPVRIEKVTLDTIVPVDAGSSAVYRGTFKRPSTTEFFGKPEEVPVRIGADINHLGQEMAAFKSLQALKPDLFKDGPKDDPASKRERIEKLMKTLQNEKVNLEGIAEVTQFKGSTFLVLRKAVAIPGP